MYSHNAISGALLPRVCAVLGVWCYLQFGGQLAFSSESQRALLFFPDSITGVVPDSGRFSTWKIRIDNLGDVGVAIVKNESTCGCVTSIAAATFLNPHCSTWLTIALAIEPTGGRRHEAVIIRTRGDADATYRIPIDIDIKPQLMIEPRLLTWDADRQSTAKTIRVSTRNQMALKLIRLETAGNSFLASVSNSSREEFSISVSPSNAAAPGASDVLTIRLELENFGALAYTVFLRR